MRYVVGCMSGTSIDGIDAALVAIDGHGLSMQVELIHFTSLTFGSSLADSLRQLADQKAHSPAEISKINYDFSQAHNKVIKICCTDQQADFICLHGQTVFHKPPLSWQLINPSIIAQDLHTDVVFDLRAADLACGGQGAPITPLADYILFQENNERRSICNLGGFCNITQLPAEKNVQNIQGFDLCACNHVLDFIARTRLECAFDQDGQQAQQGTHNADAAAAILKYLQSQRQTQQSLGTGDELFEFITQLQQKLSGPDLANSACQAIARCISLACTDSDILVAAGGGTANRCLMNYLNQDIKTVSSDQFGIPAPQREAVAMAVLGACCQDKIPITIPHITGVSNAPLAGTWAFYS